MMEIEGGCHCGAIRYRARIEPADVCICHCTDCQHLTGTPYRVTAFAAPHDVELSGAEPRTYEKGSDSGRRRLQHFCGTCGSPLFTSSASGEGPWGIRWGTIDGRDALRPTRQIWCRSAVPWLAEVPDLPGHERDNR